MKLSELIGGKKVLFICPAFQHYHTLINKELKKNGADVFFIPTYKEPLIKRLLRIDLQAQLEKYYSGYQDLLLKNKFDYVFIIKGDGFTEKLMKSHFCYDCRKISYQWDSQKNWDYSRIIPLFEKVYSFDPGDCLQDSRLKYTLNFYRELKYPLPAPRYDVIIVGGYAAWRYNLVSSFSNLCKKNNLSTYFKLVISFRSYLKLLIKGEKPKLNLLSFARIKETEYNRIFASALSVLDVPSPEQSGFSLRVIEAIATQKKLIITNRNIQKEEFYSAENIYILGDGVNDEKAILDFIRKKATTFPDMSHLLLENWLVKILS